MKKKIVKIFAIAMSLALLLCMVPALGNDAQAAPAESANLLADKNYSLEDTAVGADPSGWSYIGVAQANSAVTDEKASDGSKSLKLTVPANTTSAYYIATPMFDVSTLDALRLSLDYIAPLTVRVWVQFFTATDTTTAMEQKWWVADAATDWNTFNQVYTVPTGAVYARLLLQQAKENAGDNYFDNFVVEGAISLWCYDGMNRGTFAYDAVNYDFANATYDGLASQGWVYGSQATAARTSISDGALKCDNSTTESVYAVYSPAIYVSGKATATATMKIRSDINVFYYLYFYKADGTQIAAGNGVREWVDLNGISAWTNGATSEWHTVTLTRDVPSDAAYARIMLYKTKNTKAAAYFDDVQLTAATTAPQTTTAPTTTVPTTTAPATTAPATTAPATTAPATTAPATTAAATTSPAATNPDTGDNSGITAMLIVMLLSVTTLAALVSTKFIRK